MFWNIDPKDYMINAVDSNLKSEIESIKNGSVILLHDGRARRDDNPQTTIELLEIILEKSKKDNLKCTSVDDL
jgi:peptidoglycan/xylan/chitin deacetylase (PgdA/CDA1 family)